MTPTPDELQKAANIIDAIGNCWLNEREELEKADGLRM